jgi:hypothetical protein
VPDQVVDLGVVDLPLGYGGRGEGVESGIGSGHVKRQARAVLREEKGFLEHVVYCEDSENVIQYKHRRHYAEQVQLDLTQDLVVRGKWE